MPWIRPLVTTNGWFFRLSVKITLSTEYGCFAFVLLILTDITVTLQAKVFQPSKGANLANKERPQMFSKLSLIQGMIML